MSGPYPPVELLAIIESYMPVGAVRFIPPPKEPAELPLTVQPTNVMEYPDDMLIAPPFRPAELLTSVSLMSNDWASSSKAPPPTSARLPLKVLLLTVNACVDRPATTSIAPPTVLL